MSARAHAVLYGSVGVLIALIDYPLVILVPAYLNKKIGMSLTDIAWLFGMLRLVDTASDIGIGVLADRYLKSEQQLRTLVLAAIPATALAAFLSYRLPSESATLTVAACLLGLLISRSLLDIPHIALGGLYQNARRKIITTAYYGWRSVFLVFGTLLVAVTLQLSGGSEADGLDALAFLIVPIALLTGLAQLPSFGARTATSHTDGSRRYQLQPSVWEKWFLAAFFLNQTANAFAASLVAFYIEYYLQLPRLTGLFLGSLFLASALSVPFWSFLAARFDMVVAWASAIAASCVIFISVAALGAGDSAQYFVVCLLAGVCFGADAVLPPSIIARRRLADERNTLVSGIFGLKSTLSKASLFVPLLVALPVLDAFGFRPEQGKVEETGLVTLLLLYAVVPVGFKGASLLILTKKLGLRTTGRA